jgi:hypothetical protein
MGREVKIAAAVAGFVPCALTQLDEVLQLARMPMQTISLIDDNRN